MNKGNAKNKIAVKRLISAVMATAFLCCFGCAKPEEDTGAEDPGIFTDTGYITLKHVEDEGTKISFEPVASEEEDEPSEAEPAYTHVVNAEEVNLRSGSSTSYDIVVKLNKGTAVTVYSTENGWHRVKTADGKVGFISADFVSTTAGGFSYGTVSARGVKLRTGPSTSYDKIAELDKGTELIIYALENGWYKVKTDTGAEGHISADFVSTATDADGEEDEEGTSEPTEKPSKTDSSKDDEKAESTPKPTEKPKKKVNTPYAKKYTKVKVNYVDADPITFSTSTMSGDGVSQSMFAKNAITVVNIWTRT